MNKSILESAKTALRIPPEFAALLPALQLRRPDTTHLKALSDREWASLLTFSNLAQLSLPIAQLPMVGFPDWIVEQLKINIADNALRFERVKATYREADEALRHAGVEHVVIKGFTQAPDYVASPQLRPQSDIDIFCPSESIDAAYSALQSIGYKPSSVKISYAFADHRVTLVRPGNWQWRGNPFDPEMPLSIELHFCLWNEGVSRIRDPGTDLFWERRTRREVEGLSFACLSPVDHLAFLTLHILRNLFLREWIIHHVRELAFFLHTHTDDEQFWEIWRKTHSPLLRSYEAIAFYYAHAWFGCLMHPFPAREISCLQVTQQSWLRYFSGSALESMFHPNKDSVWLHLSLLASLKDKWKLLSRTFIPNSNGRMGLVSLQVLNRRLIQPRGKRPWQHYIDCLIFRSVAYARCSLSTLRRGLLWRLSEDTPSPSFLTGMSQK
jgi:Uncharacterised nucleotidyltransferase